MYQIKFLKEIAMKHLFATSTLQQSASGKNTDLERQELYKLHRLYQGIDIDGDTVGLITYMRTDGTNISKEAVKDFRNIY